MTSTICSSTQSSVNAQHMNNRQTNTLCVVFLDASLKQNKAFEKVFHWVAVASKKSSKIKCALVKSPTLARGGVISP